MKLMYAIKRIVSAFTWRDPRFPKWVRGHWYCGSWYLYLSKLRELGGYSATTLNTPLGVSPAVGEVAFNPFRTGHASSDTSGLVDGLIPAKRVGCHIGLYEQVGKKYRDTSHYDGAPWDDGYKIDLRFVRAIRERTLNESEVSDGIHEVVS